MQIRLEEDRLVLGRWLLPDGFLTSERFEQPSAVCLLVSSAYVVLLGVA